MTTTPPAPCQRHKADPHHPCAAACAAPESVPQDERLVRLRAFMDEHDIAWVDIAEELGLNSNARAAIYSMLVNNKTMNHIVREKLLDLGFPEDTLPPERTRHILKNRRIPRFPRCRAQSSNAAPQAPASAG